jgi:hypothetical protein
MTGGWKRSGRVVLATLIVALAGCIDAGDVGGPAAAVVATDGAVYDLLTATFPNPSGNGVSCDPSGQEPSSSLRSAAWIDSKGGELTISGGLINGVAVAHVLTVPAQTVQTPTLFCMRLVPNNHMRVKLEALAPAGPGKVINVGEAGFQQPVLLTLSYAPLSLTLTQSKQLGVVNDKETGAPVEPARSTMLLPGLRVQAELDHFSTWALGSKYAMAVD